MKRSQRILEKNGDLSEMSWQKQKTVENGVLLRHIIDNDLKNVWRLMFVMLGLVAGLYAKSFFIGG